MYDLNTIQRMNAAPVAAVENETSRHCSFTGNAERGIVLHSAKLRSTAFVSAGLYSKIFLAKAARANTPAKLDRLIESEF